MSKFEIDDFGLKKHSSISGAFVYTPIEEWHARDVWIYLLQVPSPWNDNNKELLQLYRKCDSECPLVIDKSTPACGGSRFGCWTCTVVKRDRSIEGLIEDGETWLEPLLEFRNWLKEIRNDPKMRENFRKTEKKKKMRAEFLGKDFKPQKHRGHKVLGPFTFETRHEILRRLIHLQKQLSDHDLSLISPEEIQAIEIIWIYEGDDISSIMDVINSDNEVIEVRKDMDWINNLTTICDANGIHPSLIERLLIVERDFSSLSRRSGILNRLEKVIEEQVIQMISLEIGAKK